MNILVTGANGFAGKNLVSALKTSDDTILEFDIDNSDEELFSFLNQADIIFHLAGVNRPQNTDEFNVGNKELTEKICDYLISTNKQAKIVLSSSIQAELDNPYGVSKHGAEEAVRQYAVKSASSVVVYRLKNLFGKWCRPNYNSVTATFCHNIANNLPIQISAPENEVDLTYIDDVVIAFKNELSDKLPGFRFAPPLPSRKITLGTLSELIYSFNKQRKSLLLPDFSDQFVRNLYGTYLSYLKTDDFSYTLDIKSDNRGSLAELLKSPYIGQVFISRTLPGITRGNHYHHTKTEKFMVVQGKGIIRFRNINNDEVIEYPVEGSEYKVVDIPPGYTHSIENVGDNEMVTIFWAVEIFNPEKPDTYFVPVIKAE